MKLVLCVLITSFLSFSLLSVKQSGAIISNVDRQDLEEKDWILWNPQLQLKWQDFQGEIDNSSPYKALTSTRIKSYCVRYTDSIVEYNFKCFFEKKLSWKKKESNNLLRHEQLHFDIAELATRKLREKFCDYRFTILDSINPMISRIFNEAVQLRRTLNRKYDLETNHGTIESKQLEWEHYIAEELRKLDNYSGTTVVVRRVP